MVLYSSALLFYSVSAKPARRLVRCDTTSVHELNQQVQLFERIFHRSRDKKKKKNRWFYSLLISKKAIRVSGLKSKNPCTYDLENIYNHTDIHFLLFCFSSDTCFYFHHVSSSPTSTTSTIFYHHSHFYFNYHTATMTSTHNHIDITAAATSTN